MISNAGVFSLLSGANIFGCFSSLTLHHVDLHQNYCPVGVLQSDVLLVVPPGGALLVVLPGGAQVVHDHQDKLVAADAVLEVPLEAAVQLMGHIHTNKEEQLLVHPAYCLYLKKSQTMPFLEHRCL